MIESLRLAGVTFSYGTHEPVLENLSCELPMNQAVWIRSRGEHGRSTLLKLMALLLTPDKGDYEINGESTREMSFEESVRYRLQIGYGFDMGGLLHNRSLRENLLLPLMYHNVCSTEEAHERVDGLFAKFGLLKIAGALPSAVSGGQRKAVTLMRALLLEPEVLLLDEPTQGLSAQTHSTLVRELSELRLKGVVRHVYIVTSDDSFARLQTDSVLDFTSRSLEIA